MFSKVLIANRGAIAVRICRTLKQLGVSSVAIYSEADRHSLHRRVADEAWPLGAGNATETYLNQEKLFAIAQECGADAIHPGYGFFSENADFVRACENRGIAFIGPTAEQIAVFGLKHTARHLAEVNNVALLPGSNLLDNVAEALNAADIMGYPVIIKSTAGGGGIGMQVCENATTLKSAFDRIKRLSTNNFAHDGVYLEKYVAQARHIEVQIFGDGKGGVLALGERDCSAQRRHQKVLEETPAANLSARVREQLQQTAVRLTAAVQYRNAGTVEFIYDPDSEQFWFLEVNTRLQVEHGVTEMVYGVDLVAWMLQLAADELPALTELTVGPARGWAIQARLYAEDPHKQFQPNAGLLTQLSFPEAVDNGPDQVTLRIDHWLTAGLEVSALYDPMLAMLIVHANDREAARAALDKALAETCIEGIESNRDYLRGVLQCQPFQEGTLSTRFLNDFTVPVHRIDVLSPGTMTTVQDYPGRVGYWHVGVPPSGPFDMRSFRLGNRLLGNAEDSAGLEMTLNGPTLQFSGATEIILTGAIMAAELDGKAVPFNEILYVESGQTLVLGKARHGARAYLTLRGGIQCSAYLGSRSTFTLGQFGGHGGRALRAGDVLHLAPKLAPANRAPTDQQKSLALPKALPQALIPALGKQWQLRVIYGPHGAPDFFTAADIRAFFAANWEVHYNSSRTGIRLLGPKPQWARSDGGEAGMHPSNIHDNAYAIGAVDYTGDMPVILGPDGPSLGGFVCPATVISADLWKLGQLQAGDTLQFVPVSIEEATILSASLEQEVLDLSPGNHPCKVLPLDDLIEKTPVINRALYSQTGPTDVDKAFHTETSEDVVYRPAGDRYLLVEYGPIKLDIRLRFRVHALMLWLQEQAISGVLELTPGIRSLQIHYDKHCLTLPNLLIHLENAERDLGDIEQLELPSRTVYLPLSWNDAACQEAVAKYMQSVRKDAPWCPDNIEFIRRINGLDSIKAVKQIVFEASYVVMGLGDVYLGAPVATPLDPRHRLVTTKYNPARTWTAENSVGIGGSYLCVYGMEGPGGYQFIGRTLQMWNRFQRTREFDQPWLLRFFDQIRFYEVSSEELLDIREEFPYGAYPLRIENASFKLSDYEKFLEDNQSDIDAFTQQRDRAFQDELERWIANGQLNFDATTAQADGTVESFEVPEGTTLVESHVTGSIWQLKVKEGDQLASGQVVAILESMKMEIELLAPTAGTVLSILRQEGQAIVAGQGLLVLGD